LKRPAQTCKNKLISADGGGVEDIGIIDALSEVGEAFRNNFILVARHTLDGDTGLSHLNDVEAIRVFVSPVVNEQSSTNGEVAIIFSI